MIVETRPPSNSVEVRILHSELAWSPICGSAWHNVNRTHCIGCVHRQVLVAILESLPGCSYDNVQEVRLADLMLVRCFIVIKETYPASLFGIWASISSHIPSVIPA
jgi:hypothetical protein